MDYLKTFDISELITYLEKQSHSDNFKMVEKILLSREENMIKRADSLEKNLELYRSKCFKLSLSLDKKNKKIVAMEVKIEKLKDCQMICDKLEENVTHLEKDCEIISEREKAAIQNVIDLEQLSSSRDEELNQIKVENKILKCGKEKADNEIETQKKRYEDFEMMMKYTKEMERELETHKTSCLELSAALEDEKKKGIAVESRLEEFKGYKKICEVLQEKVIHLDENCKNVRERENRAIQRCKELEKIIKLTTELEKDLEKDFKMCRDKCSELSMALGDMKKKNIALEHQLEESNRCNIICNELKEKIVCLEEDCKNVGEREKRAIQNISKLTADLEKFSRIHNEELIELKTKNRNLECAKRKAEDEIKYRKKRYKKLKTRVSKLENGTLASICEPRVSAKGDLEVGSDVSNNESSKGDCKHIQSKTNGRVNGTSSSKLIIKLKSSRYKCGEVSSNDGNKYESKQGKFQSETNGGMNGACPSQLNIKLKTSSYKCRGKDHDSSGAASNCHAAVKVSGGGQVEGSAMSSLKSPVTTEAGTLRKPEKGPAKGSLFSGKIDDSQNYSPGQLQRQVDMDSMEASAFNVIL